MNRLLILLIPLLFCACDSVFDIHPYDAHVDGVRGLNASGMEAITAACAGKDTLRFAFFADTHVWYSDTRDIITDINLRSDSLDFAIHGGDLTDTGTTLEYRRAREQLLRLRLPWVALIGNHDFLGTGDQVFAAMFGAKDFAFLAGNVKFVCLNTNATEYDYLAAVPNFDFMEAEMQGGGELFERTVIVMHARPGSDQFNNKVDKAFGRYILDFPNLLFCLSAHDHQLQADDLYGNGLMFYGTDCALHRAYLLFTITPTGYTYEVVRI